MEKKESDFLGIVKIILVLSGFIGIGILLSYEKFTLGIGALIVLVIVLINMTIFEKIINLLESINNKLNEK